MTQPGNPFRAPQPMPSLADFTKVNPGLTPFEARAPGIPEQSTYSVSSIDRVMLAGSQLMQYVTPSSITPLEFLFRRLPEDGVFSATPNKPFQFEMGSMQVPQAQGFVLLDYNFDIYRLSGAAAGDYVPIEENRLSTQVGWNIQSNANRQGNYSYQINPVPPAGSRPGYESNPNPGFIPGTPNGFSSNAAFEQARFTTAQSATGDALSLMPQRHFRNGRLPITASWVLRASQSLAFSCRVFRAIPIPIGFFEVSFFGFLLPDPVLEAIQKRMAPMDFGHP